MSIRKAIRKQVHELVGARTDDPVQRPRQKEGLFGPKSVSWKVHGDFTSMMVGGVSALFLQMLHPRALAGVWDHSDFRADMLGRLRRTAQFIAATTYGSTEDAHRAIDHVRVIHDRVYGNLPDGTPYSANDPDLLTWIHVAELSSFLRAYLRYHDPTLPTADQDRYFAENAVVAERLGAQIVPISRREADDYLHEIRPELKFDARTLKVASALINQPAPSPLMRPFSFVTMRAGVELLPPWAMTMHGFHLSPRDRQVTRQSVSGIGSIARWALR